MTICDKIIKQKQENLTPFVDMCPLVKCMDVTEYWQFNAIKYGILNGMSDELG